MSLSFLAALSAVRRHWALVVVAIALLAATAAYVGKLRSERALENCRGRLALATLQLERASQAVTELRRDSERRAADQARRLREARRQDRAVRPAIERLMRSSARPPTQAGCAVSQTLKEMEENL
jgi:hypothetical protein